ncbi:hypothetical protein [Deefgea rivuli]|uniref:hypothetical protein n=1 Tax=Deefgea rivuli TaxID=400948 RepID=UPI00056A6A39|nr:hypothetical protein [Deefgea rivuli]
MDSGLDELISVATLGGVLVTASELLSVVSVHTNRHGQPHFIVLNDIPEPWHTQFKLALRGSACPQVMGFAECAFAVDWTDWVNGEWRDRAAKPIGLDDVK